MAKRLTEKQIEQIKKLFISGINIDQISKDFNCTKLTISRNLKKNLGESKYKQFLEKNKLNNKIVKNKQQINNHLDTNDIKEKQKHISNDHKENVNLNIDKESHNISEFIEISPLNFDIENSQQKDFSSIPISEIDFPKTVFMIVDKKVELEIKYLKDFPKWEFLSKDDLERKTIEIYFDLRIAKSFCNKEQKVIKVPNTNVFKIVAPLLLSRGISRIVSSDTLIAL